MKRVDKVKEWFNKTFMKPEEGKEGEFRRIHQSSDTGKINWTKGKKPFTEGPDEEPEVKYFKFEDDKKKGTRLFEPVPEYEPYRKNRFKVEFPGIPPYFFQSYKYVGTDVHSEKKLAHSKKIIKDDYSSFRVLMLFPNAEIDICEKLKELEGSPKVGEVKIHILDPTGVTVKTILIPECEVTEIKAFRDFDYGDCGDKSDALLYGEITIKHKQRRLF